MHEFDDATTVERMLMQHATKTKTPINGSIELLPLCNMNCDMCYVRLSKEEMESQGRLRTTDEWLEIAGQMQKSGVLFLLLTGGEPLLYPDFKHLFTELKKMGMILTINTNGTLIDEEWAKFFAQVQPRRINITLYGADNNAYENLCHYPGGFDKVIHGIHLLKKYNIDVKIGGSLTKANKDDVEKLVEIGKELDVPVRIDTYMMPAVRERNKPYDMQSRLDPETAAQARIQALKSEMGNDLFDQYVHETLHRIEIFIPPSPEFADQTNRITCHAGNCSFTINWQGEMRPCVVMSEPAISVFDVGFEKAWHYITEETSKIRLSSKCSSCALKCLCRTCAACALLETGRYEDVPDYMCRYTKESFRLLHMKS